VYPNDLIKSKIGCGFRGEVGWGRLDAWPPFFGRTKMRKM